MAGKISNTNVRGSCETGEANRSTMFAEMVGWTVNEGADLIIGETFYYAGEALTALKAAQSIGTPTKEQTEIAVQNSTWRIGNVIYIALSRPWTFWGEALAARTDGTC